jgi:uncharacterized membrane protein YhaH (DUF805 family)
MRRLIEYLDDVPSQMRRFYFSFDGEIVRSQFWLGILSIALCGPMVLTAIALCQQWLGALVVVFLLVVANAYFVVGVWAMLALSVKRLRNLDKGASWLWLFYGVPVACQVLLYGLGAWATTRSDGTISIGVFFHPVWPSANRDLASNVVSLLSVIILAWAIFELGIRRSSRGGGYLHGRDAIRRY